MLEYQSCTLFCLSKYEVSSGDKTHEYYGVFLELFKLGLYSVQNFFTSI